MEAYLPAAPILALLALALPAWFSTEAHFRALVAKERVTDCLRVAALQVGLGIAALTLATKIYGAVGAAWLGTAGYVFFLLRDGAVPLRGWMLVLLIGGAVVGGSHALARLSPPTL